MVAIDVASESITPVCALSGGHSGTVRSFVYLPEERTLITVGEDSNICLWSEPQL